MKTQNRKTLYSDEMEDLADLLANKSRHEIYDILEEYDSVLVLTFTGRYTAMQRATQILTIPVIPLFFILMGIKWIVTGDKYLDSWFRKVGLSANTMDKYFV